MNVVDSGVNSNVVIYCRIGQMVVIDDFYLDYWKIKNNPNI
jgi:hypothetical protein